MNGHRSLLVLAASLLVVAPQAAGATKAGASCANGSRTLAAAKTLTEYNDDIEDAGNAPDFCGDEIVTNDNETVTIGIHVHNRSGFTPGDSYSIQLDTDRASAAPEFEIAFDAAGAQLRRWNGTDFETVTTARVAIDWLDGYGPVLDLPRADLGNPSAFGLVFVSTDGSGADRAPDEGSWNYAVTPLKLSVRSLSISGTRAGQMLTARALVLRSDWEIPLTEGRIACAAHIGARHLNGHGTFARDRATCSWRLPANASRKQLSGNVAVAFEGVRAGRSFSLRVG